MTEPYGEAMPLPKSFGRSGQTAVEYLLTTVALVTVFAGMFAFLQGQLKFLFTKAGVKILSTYPK